MESRCEAAIGTDFENIKDKTLTIVGAGGTGATVINILARLPFKKIILIDDDVVEESNLERQLLFFKSDLAKTKIKAIEEKLIGFCPITYLDARIDETNADLLSSDLVIDCTDNLKSRRIIHTYCQKKNLPWIFSGVLKNIGQVYFISPNSDNVLKLIEKADVRCKDPGVGVVNSAVSIIASWTANLVISYLTTGYVEKNLLRFNFDTNDLLKLKL